MQRFLLLSTVLTLLGGCGGLAVTLTEPRTARQQAMVPDPLAVAYPKAQQAAMRLGGHLMGQDATQRAVSARLNKAVVLNITLTPQDTGTRLDVQATAEPGYILAHDVDVDVQAFLTAYRQQ